MLSDRNVEDPFLPKNVTARSKTTSIYIVETLAIIPSTVYINVCLAFDI